MTATSYPEELIELCEYLDDLFWEQNPDGGSHEEFYEWANQLVCRDHFDAVQLATGMECLRCGIEHLLEIDDLGAPADDE